MLVGSEGRGGEEALLLFPQKWELRQHVAVRVLADGVLLERRSFYWRTAMWCRISPGGGGGGTDANLG